MKLVEKMTSDLNIVCWIDVQNIVVTMNKHVQTGIVYKNDACTVNGFLYTYYITACYTHYKKKKTKKKFAEST